MLHIYAQLLPDRLVLYRNLIAVSLMQLNYLLYFWFEVQFRLALLSTQDYWPQIKTNKRNRLSRSGLRDCLSSN